MTDKPVTHKFTITRKNWLRGRRAGLSRLRLPTSEQCCLGFYLESLGTSPEDTHEKAYPSELKNKLPSAAKWLVEEPGLCAGETAEHHLARLNDSQYHASEEIKEGYIKREFASRGIEVTFED